MWLREGPPACSSHAHLQLWDRRAEALEKQNDPLKAMYCALRCLHMQPSSPEARGAPASVQLSFVRVVLMCTSPGVLRRRKDGPHRLEAVSF